MIKPQGINLLLVFGGVSHDYHIIKRNEYTRTNPSISVLPSQINHHLYFLFKRFKQNDLHLENLSPRRPPSMQFLACKNNSTTFTTYKEEKIPHYYLLLFFIKLKIVLLVPTTYIFFLFIFNS